jgi:two-component sensor histidine kinase
VLAARNSGGESKVITESKSSAAMSGRDRAYFVARLEEVEHRHRNVIQIMSSLVRQKLRTAESSEAIESLSFVGEMIDTLAAMERLSEDDGGADLSQRLKRMARQWQRLCNGHVSLIVDVPPQLPGRSLSQAVIASVISQELVLNAIKHAFPERRSGLIRLGLRRTGKECVLVVEDDGVGFDKSAKLDPAVVESSAGRGSAVVDSLVGCLNGTVERRIPEFGRGHRVIVRWPS